MLRRCLYRMLEQINIPELLEKTRIDKILNFAEEHNISEYEFNIAMMTKKLIEILQKEKVGSKWINMFSACNFKIKHDNILAITGSWISNDDSFEQFKIELLFAIRIVNEKLKTKWKLEFYKF